MIKKHMIFEFKFQTNIKESLTEERVQYFEDMRVKFLLKWLTIIALILLLMNINQLANGNPLGFTKA